MKNYLSLFLCLIIAMFIGGVIGHFLVPQRGSIPPIETKVDTLVIHDTITHSEPVYVSRRVIEKELVPVVDTMRVHDTLYVAMDREQVRWEDSLGVVYASGIHPQVDSVKHYITERVITIETSVPVRVKNKWGLGLQGGYGVGKDGLTPWVGVGISYNILTW